MGGRICIKRLICYSASLTSHPEMRDVDKEEISVDFSKAAATAEKAADSLLTAAAAAVAAQGIYVQAFLYNPFCKLTN